MKVPLTHFIYFWIVNSVMSFGTGTVMGYFALKVFGGYFFKPAIDFPLEYTLISSAGFYLFYQYIAASCFWGKRRGVFEYSFLEKSAVNGDLDNELSRQLKAVKRELRFGGVSSAHEKLIEAAKAFPDNFVVHFMFALSCERMGLAEAAIGAYETACGLLPASSQALNTYVEKQIGRVKSEGPSKMSIAPGLQYLMW